MSSDGKDAPPPMSGRVWAMLLTMSVLWGGSFFFNGVAVRELPSFTLVWLRVATAAVILVGVLRLTGQRLPTRRPVWIAFFGMGLLNNVVPFALIVWGQHHIGSGLASILNATTPLFTVLAAHFLTPDERLTRLKAIGVAVGFAGAVLMIGPDALAGVRTDVIAQLACLAGALTYAFAAIFGRRFRRLGVPPMATATGQVCASTLLLLPVMLAVDQPWTLAQPHIQTWLAVVGVGLFSTALGYLLYFRILELAGATNLVLVTFLIPASAIFLGAVLLGERLLPRHFAGLLVIGLGLAFMDGRLPRWLAGRFRPALDARPDRQP